MPISWMADFSANPKSTRKIVLFCVAFGMVFGLIAALTFFFFGMLPKPMPALLTLPLLASLISGLAGLLSVFVDRLLLRSGLNRQGQRNLIIYAVMAAVAIGIGSLIFAVFGLQSWKPFLWGTTMGCLLGVTVIFVYLRFERFHDRVADLEEKNRYLVEIAKRDQALKQQSERMAVMEERTRIARDLHDSISQDVHGLVYLIRSLKASVPLENQRAAEIVDQLEKTVDATSTELKTLIMELKPSVLEEHGLAETLRIHANRFTNHTGIELVQDVENISGLSPDQEIAVYRIAQEAFANIRKHSRARKVRLSLSKKADTAILIVEDDGIGFDRDRLPSSGNGLANMAARCRENQGQFQLTTTPGHGVTIAASFQIK